MLRTHQKGICLVRVASKVPAPTCDSLYSNLGMKTHACSGSATCTFR